MATNFTEKEMADLKKVYKIAKSKNQLAAAAIENTLRNVPNVTMKHVKNAIQKAAISTGVFTNGGSLTVRQQKVFLKYVKDFATMLRLCRTHKLTNPTEDIDKMYAGEPITKPATQGATTGKVLVEPKHNKVTLSTTKVRSDWEINTETIQNAISQNEYEQDVFGLFLTRVASDLELLGILGDTTSGVGDPRSLLLSIKDGWYKQSLSGHIVNVGGASISKGVFARMWDSMPQEYRDDPGLRFFISKGVELDWRDLVSDRATPLGDNALGGGSLVSPFGVPIVSVPYIPDDLAISVGTATPAKVIGVQADPFVITAGLTVILNINAIGTSTTTIATAGTYKVSEIAKLINAQLVTDGQPPVAGDNGLGYLTLETPTTGTSASINVGSGTANTILGLTNATTTGANAGNNTLRRGSFIWLCNPKNFIFGVLDGTRIFSEFKRDTDQIAVTMYNQIDFKIENIDAVVTCTNLLRRELE